MSVKIHGQAVRCSTCHKTILTLYRDKGAMRLLVQKHDATCTVEALCVDLDTMKRALDIQTASDPHNTIVPRECGPYKH